MAIKPNIKNKITKLLISSKFEVAFKQLKKSRRNAADEKVWVRLSGLCGELQLPDGIIRCCQMAIAVNSQYALAYSHMGNAFLMKGNIQKAASFSQHAAQLSPDDAAIQYNFGMILRHLGMYDEAIIHISRAVEIKPEKSTYHYTLASCYQAIADADSLVFHYGRALELNPAMVECYINLGHHYAVFGDIDKALDYFNKALSLNAGSGSALSGKAGILLRTGEREEAYSIVRDLIDKGEVTPTALQAYSQLSSDFGESQEVINLSEKMLKKPGIAGIDRSILGFTLGKMYEKGKDYNRAFDSYKLANEASYGKFNREDYKRYIDNIIATYSEEAIHEMPLASTVDERPIFILGMPRSGTSLVEQLLSQHSKVYAAGELVVLNDIKNLISKDVKGAVYPMAVASLTSENLDKYQKIYSDYIGHLSSSEFITDKMPTNFLYIGLISQLFPQAKILHCSRDPRDTCLSIYFQNFQNFQPYSSNLKDIATVYCEYERLMEHWQSVVDVPILEIPYESVVNDFSTYARKIVEFCGLDWEPACLDFYKSRRTVNTASFDQVNKPIYRKSMARWKNYEKHISDMLEILNVTN